MISWTNRTANPLEQLVLWGPSSHIFCPFINATCAADLLYPVGLVKLSEKWRGILIIVIKRHSKFLSSLLKQYKILLRSKYQRIHQFLSSASNLKKILGTISLINSLEPHHCYTRACLELQGCRGYVRQTLPSGCDEILHLTSELKSASLHGS